MNLSDLLHEAVDDLEPSERIGALRARTAGPSVRRRWTRVAAVGAVAAAAAVALLVVTDSGRWQEEDGAPVVEPSATQLVPVYFLGTTPSGERLFRELDEVPAGDPLAAALERVQQPPDDPDYATAWDAGTLLGVEVVDGVVEVRLGTAGVPSDLAAQQVVQTVHAVTGRSLPVRFGDGPLVRADRSSVSTVLVDRPTDGLAVSGGFTAEGTATTFEGTVVWEIRDERDEVVLNGHTTTSEAGEPAPWSARVDVRDLPLGSYVFVATSEDASSGEGPEPDRDTRTIIVR